ncbi:MAG: 16S rRNA (guanine(527)-N(7))-methyltransferase RsmG [Acutalibacteraceae bacterium]|nr:16S rRNA (guanine(527)-N(7))-methyltransferase RsmG [Acutalibacteraceae bacterium]
MFDFIKLKALCAPFFTLTDEMCEQLRLYGEMLIEWNEKMNLTAIKEPDEILIKHFYDCLLFLKNVEIPQKAKVIDVGTGAGFPGVVLKIARPDIQLTLLDGLNKRITFLNAVLEKIGLSATAVHGRAEEFAKKPEYRETYDIACARAVARLNVLTEYCLPFVKSGGQFVSMKGPAAEEELAEAKKAISVLGGEKGGFFAEKLPDESQRCFIKIKKLSQTPTKYPRNSGKITKQPL